MAGSTQEAAIAELLNLGIERTDALACLSACENDIARAADYFFGGDLQKAKEDHKWNASLFDAPREGHLANSQSGHSYDNNYQSEFQIQAPDVRVGGGYEGTKSRPSSRISNRAGESAVYQDSDPDLARALAASMEGSSAHATGPQETGITGTRTSPVSSYLTPANPNREYNPIHWALTTTHEIFLDPAPPERKRKPGEPAFLRPGVSGSNLAALLTILHGIPAARESLLARDCLDRDYGHDDQWWNGQPIRILRVTNINDEESTEPELTEEVMEVQRLMAFLDGTTRAYGSVESLAQIPNYQEHLQTSALATFFTAWTKAIKRVTLEPDEGKYSRTFFSQATQCIRGTNEAAMNLERFQVMDLVGPSPGETNLYDMLDTLVFPVEDEVDVFVKFAPVICAQIRPPDNTMFSGCPISIPTALYPGRYTKAWGEPMREIRRQMEEQRNIIAEIELKEDKLKRLQVNSGANNEFQNVYQPRELLSSLIEHYSSREEGGETPVRFVDGIESQSGTAFLGMLGDVVQQLDKKLEALAKQKDEAYEALIKLKSSFTSPEDLDPSLPQLSRYTLRGICPDGSTTFVLLPSPESEEDQTSAGPSTASSGEQWWCMSWGPPKTPTNGWDTTPTLSYDVSRVTEEKVLHATKTMGEGTVLLVYASDEAVNPSEGIDASLPYPLQNFVDRDNATFRAELRPNSPGRKRHNECLDMEEEGATPSPTIGFSPKKISSSRSSATLGNTTPEPSCKNSMNGNDVEMVEGIGGGRGADVIDPTDLPPPGNGEMQERDGISPVAMAFRGGFKGRDRDLDQEMKDAESEHVEFADKNE